MFDVSAFRIAGAFVVVLITNITVLLGIISFVYWVDLQPVGTRVQRHSLFLKLALGTVFLAYLYGESWINANMGPQAFGYHWAYMNMMTVTTFMVTTRCTHLWQLLGADGLILVYVLTRTIHTGDLLWVTIPLILCCTVMNYFGGKLAQRSRIVAYGLLLLTGAAGIMLNWAMGINESFTLVPLFWERQWLGLAILGIVAVEYATALSHALKRNRQMSRDARIDSLTQISNFNTFNQDLSAHYDAYQHDHHGYMVFEMDIDWFKRINDTYGHLAGNKVLAAVAHALAQCVKGNPWPAVAYRLGGEEFGVIMDGEVDQATAFKVADHFKQLVLQLRFPQIDQQLHITVSIGQASVHNEHYSFNDAYKQADRNLYVAKQSGRNRITVEGMSGMPATE